MPLIPFDIRDGHTAADPRKFSNGFSDSSSPATRRAETGYSS
jgi:hypothetical protein